MPVSTAEGERTAKCEAVCAILPGQPQLRPGEEMLSPPSGSHAASPGAQPRKPARPDVGACPEGKPLGAAAHPAEEDAEDDGLFIPMGRLSFSVLSFFKLKAAIEV